ncbi:hypothetical protein QVD17_10681 [Tagetes erecta]|uniref:Uncharacterized protein n=1 Tax=Tagetes erecta TaxID=13708 RepID=A0AAD8L3T6_TARER|nr:hypothetical protein QVD17_10681 [Tagetes erecta]
MSSWPAHTISAARGIYAKEDDVNDSVGVVIFTTTSMPQLPFLSLVFFYVIRRPSKLLWPSNKTIPPLNRRRKYILK